MKPSFVLLAALLVTFSLACSQSVNTPQTEPRLPPQPEVWEPVPEPEFGEWVDFDQNILFITFVDPEFGEDGLTRIRELFARAEDDAYPCTMYEPCTDPVLPPWARTIDFGTSIALEEPGAFFFLGERTQHGVRISVFEEGIAPVFEQILSTGGELGQYVMIYTADLDDDARPEILVVAMQGHATDCSPVAKMAWLFNDGEISLVASGGVDPCDMFRVEHKVIRLSR